MVLIEDVLHVHRLHILEVKNNVLDVRNDGFLLARLCSLHIFISHFVLSPTQEEYNVELGVILLDLVCRTLEGVCKRFLKSPLAGVCPLYQYVKISIYFEKIH